ncbi:MAG: hypothetical protein FVQ81_03480 [Candidatus Glassbacteria bacterium]|nr:hypothetical protein [Candidatus Glassbacteria bacterium]
MAVEIWFLILLGAVLLTAEMVRIAGRRNAGSRPARAAGKSAGRAGVRKMANYKLAPREPDVMAGALFGLLAEILNHGQMTAFADLVTSSEMTARYIDRLAAREATAGVAEKLAFLNEAMDLNGYGGAERARVASVLKSRADNQYKLLEIHRNMDKIR